MGHCEFTVPLEQLADRQKISKLGGQVTLQPHTAITHVIYDAGRSALVLARELGLRALSELPEGTVCVRWEWVVQCKLAVRFRLTFNTDYPGQGSRHKLVADFSKNHSDTGP